MNADAQATLPGELSKIVKMFAAVPDAKLRYQQLLFYAKQLPEMDASLKTDENRVRGCTSVVHVHVTMDENQCVFIEGDSDSQLVKGLVGLVVNGLRGCTPEEVLSVDPSFIVDSGLSVSLTPSRNNGFVNMVGKVKDKVRSLAGHESPPAPSSTKAQQPPTPSETPRVLPDDDALDVDLDDDRPVYSSIMRKLSAMQPDELQVDDFSSQHAGHAGAKGFSGESHFSIRIVSDKFDGMKLLQRHRLIYKLLESEMRLAHAINVEALTTTEASSKSS